MEWYIGSGSEESDRVLESWNQSGMNAPENSWLSDKKYLATAQPKPNGGFNKYMAKNPAYERDHQSSSSSACEAGPNSEALVHMPTMLWPDQQLDDLQGIDEMDEFFLSSWLKDLPMAEDTHGSKHLKTHAFSTAVDWDNKEPPVDNDSVQSRDDEHMEDETSMAKSVLLDFESIMVQMTEKTRLFFRDAMYRLTESSKQFTLIQPQPDDTELNKPIESIACDETLRSKTTETSEPETNTIDRAIANLMFCKMQLNSQDLPTISMSGEPSPASIKEPCNYTSYQPKNPQCLHSEFPPGDREVPMFSEFPPGDWEVPR